MIFSSLLFIYLFLPLTLLGYYLSPLKIKNYWLLFTSLVFFAWGGISATIILVSSIIINYVLGRFIEKNNSYLWLVVGVALNLMLLGVFKYTNFIVYNLNELFGLIRIPIIPETNIVLPVGISFYTFHSLSYLIDIYRGKTTAQKNIFDLSLYICMFSQLIAGPIIRYSDVWQQLKNRSHTFVKFSNGIERFVLGLGKKVLLANNFALIADDLMVSDVTELSALNAWLGIICYSLQIYFDFSGYSDMAIGLGKMFGFEFKENFNFPYIAKSIKDFWRKWHISLSSFFRDYVYIPLGGNRVGKSRIYINIIIVFFLTGFWHGANWTFILWGLFHGFFMVIERLGLEKTLEKLWNPLPQVYTLLVVMFAWVLFRADTVSYAYLYWKALFNFQLTNQQWSLFVNYMNIEFYLVFLIGILGALNKFNQIKCLFKFLKSKYNNMNKIFNYSYSVFIVLFYGLIIMISTVYLIAGTYNPFIYYRF